ncbi:efflux transporter outer membrane subunit [Pseudoduganella sp. DS3]|uniref:Efflux transporter outer membrane subunit n=1 Tax=Pseudoduganella guangdongensis TaxID=2692179 RepID=A0A6N9HQC7_9BURK|nr:efflux transporter outer membrane subunit [Pseudoduganella guangdongensis]MYN05527.1 efflux transporter outer membrane subunit [Pseudoduganella guangdongensis]
MKRIQGTLTVFAALALSACGVTGPASKVVQDAPQQWHTPLPHNGSTGELANWWQRQSDPLLVQLIEAAQAASPTIASAQARFAAASAERTAAGAALAPSLTGVLTSTRMSRQSADAATNTTTQLLAQAQWEIDLFGGGRARRQAAIARAEGAQAGWHEARVSVAAETANQYYSLRACQKLLTVARMDAASRAHTARLTDITTKAGFQSPSANALARASAADGNNRAVAQRAACDSELKVLVALTAITEPELRSRLADSAAAAPLSPASGVAIDSLPAQVLAQRPDVFNAERELAAASHDVASARADRLPRLGLTGSVGRGRLHSEGRDITANVWTIGPLQMTLPIIDWGVRRANVDASRARYEAAVSAYKASVRQAVAEVEQALVALQSTQERAADAQTALDGYRTFFSATEERYKNGLASLLELEDARRTRLAAENTVVSLQRERSAAWIALYRAAGGGWTAPAAP